MAALTHPLCFSVNAICDSWEQATRAQEVLGAVLVGLAMEGIWTHTSLTQIDTDDEEGDPDGDGDETADARH